MNLQWYPGHMTKARRAMEEHLKLIDVLVEIRDARIPLASANPDLAQMGQGKPRILFLNKADLADPEATMAWKEHFLAEGFGVVAGDARKRDAAQSLVKQLDVLCRKKKERDLKRGIKNRPLRIMIAGIPNVGKSTLINSMAGRASTKTGNKPGVTRGIQWIRLSSTLELMDTPGILWPKFEDEKVGLHLALMGAIKEDIIQREELAAAGIRCLNERYPWALPDKYELEVSDPLFYLEQLAVKHGLLLKGGAPDRELAAGRMLSDLQNGRLGPLSLEWVSDTEEKEKN